MPATTAAGGLSAWPNAANAESRITAESFSGWSNMLEFYHRPPSRIGRGGLWHNSLVPYRSSLCLMVSMVREGAISPLELVDAHLRRIEARNPAINAFVTVLAEEARETARAL